MPKELRSHRSPTLTPPLKTPIYANIPTAPQITHTDSSPANANITAATQIIHTDMTSANADIIAGPQTTDTDTSSANAKITGAPQITHTGTSSANANITAAPQMNHTDTSSANANITTMSQVHLTRFSRPLQMHSPLWRALRPSRKRLTMVANSCRQLRTVANTNATFGEHSLTPRPPKWNGNPRYAFGNKRNDNQKTRS